MKIKTNWLRLYQQVNEGVQPNSIIGYRKLPYFQSGIRIVSFERVLFINLWFVQLKVTWITNE